MSPGPEITVRDNGEARRYEISADGELAGFVKYRNRAGTLTLIHTEVDDRFEGQGLGGRLVAFALDDARARDFAVLPSCPFASAYIQRHPEYADLVPAERRAEFGL